jgi:hypothetical protein
MNPSDRNFNDKLKAIALEIVWVFEVILCWAVSLPVVLIYFLAIVVREKAEQATTARPSHPARLPSLKVGPDVEIATQLGSDTKSAT